MAHRHLLFHDLIDISMEMIHYIIINIVSYHNNIYKETRCIIYLMVFRVKPRRLLVLRTIITPISEYQSTEALL